MERKLGTKAETLERLYGQLEKARVLPQVSFTVEQWYQDKNAVINKVEEVSWNENVIVRSSSLNEDTQSGSQAGKYESIGNVCGKAEFEMAVEKVIQSYEDREMRNQVLVQPMLKNVKICGVAFTLDPNTKGNYYVINYDMTGSTSTITSGTGSDNKLLYIFKEKKMSKKKVARVYSKAGSYA